MQNFQYGLYTEWGASNNTITNNNFSNNQDGIYFDSAYYNDVSGNTFTNNANYGIYLDSGSYDNIIYANDFYDTAIYYQRTNRNQFCGNGTENIYNGGLIGPTCRCLTAVPGMDVSSNTTLCNYVYNLSTGIGFFGNSYSLDCNGATLSGPGSGRGIDMTYFASGWYGVDYATVKNCNVQNFQYGLYTEWGANNNTLKDNTFSNNQYGIYFDSAYYNDVSGNTFTNNANYGLYLDSGSSSNTMYGNDFYDTGIYYERTNYNQYCRNNIENRYYGGVIGPTCSCITAVPGMVVSSNTTLCNYVYYLSSGIGIWGNGKELDCNGATLVGPGSGTGIDLTYYASGWYGADYTTVKNCNINNFQYGVYFRYLADYNTVIDSSFHDNTYGLYFVSGRYAEIHNNVLLDTTYDIYSSQTYLVNATQNWWGTVNITQIEAKIFNSSGTVLYNPFLLEGPKYDISVSRGDISLEVNASQLIVHLLLHNTGELYIPDVEVQLLDTFQGNLIKQKTITVTQLFVNGVKKVNTSWTLEKNHELHVVVDPDDLLAESNEVNNYVKLEFTGSRAYFIDTDVPPSVAELEILSYLRSNLKDGYLVATETEADVAIFVANHNPLIVWNFHTDEELGRSFYGGGVRDQGEFEVKPYGGLVGSFDNAGQQIVIISGNDVEGFVAGVKEFVNNKEHYIKNEASLLINSTNIQGLAVYDFMHTAGNEPYYKTNTNQFKGIVRDALHDQMFDVTNLSVPVSSPNGTINYRLKKVLPDKSANFQGYVDPDGFPVVMAGGLWSDIEAWEDLGQELSNEGYEVYLIELTGGPGSDCDTCYDYNYSFLTDDVLPAYIAEIQNITGTTKIKYVGHSNGARVALDSLTAGKVNPADVDTLVVVGVPGNFSELSFFADIVDKSGASSVQSMRNKGINHSTFSTISFEMNNFVAKAFGIVSFFGSKDKISVSLFEQYYNWISQTSDPQPGLGLSLDYFTLIYGNVGFFTSGQDDYIVAVNDELSILNQVSTPPSQKSGKVVSSPHKEMTEDERVHKYTKKSIDKTIYS